MKLIKLVYQQYRVAFLWMLVLTSLSSFLGIFVLSFINTHLLNLHEDAIGGVLIQFAVLILFYLLISTVAQIKLAQIGQNFIFDTQLQLVKRIMDSPTAQIQLTGKAKIFASLSNDIRSMSIAFTRLPELVQGVLFTIACSIYLLMLSPKLFAVTAILLILMVVVSDMAVRQHYRYFRQMRLAEDGLYRHYETALNGHKELMLNRFRAEHFYHGDLTEQARDKRYFHVQADAFHAFTLNWGNSIMLLAVGVIFYLAVYHHWASIAEATTISMTVLFMRGPLTSAIGALPALLQSQVAVDALENLHLVQFQTAFHDKQIMPSEWREIRLENTIYSYPAQGGEIFALQPIHLTLKRGETVFLIGANGSGKSTLSMLLAGLYAPTSGKIFVDDIEITEQNRSAYRQLFASVFTDFHLFEQLMDGMGEEVSDGIINQWLAHLQLQDKVKIEKKRILNSQLSQGQKKRLGLLIAALEHRDMLILDEWAADQDPQFRRVFYEQLLPLLKQQGYTVFAISHDDKYFHHAERIISMKQGVLSELNAQEAIAVAEAHSQGV